MLIPNGRLFVLFLGPAAAVPLAGCQATQTTQSVTASADEARAAVCPQCEIVWFKPLDMNDPYMVSYGPETATVCAECRSAIESFFKTGRLARTCKTCDAMLERCTVRGE